MRSDIEQTRLIVCERPLQEHTHTSALVTTPRATENDAPKYSVYVCVVCVGGARSNDNIVLGQSKEYFFSQRVPLHDPQTRKQESLISIHRQRVYKRKKPPTNVESFFYYLKHSKNLELMCCETIVYIL